MFKIPSNSRERFKKYIASSGLAIVLLLALIPLHSSLLQPTSADSVSDTIKKFTDRDNNDNDNNNSDSSDSSEAQSSAVNNDNAAVTVQQVIPSAGDSGSGNNINLQNQENIGINVGFGNGAVNL